MRAELGPLVDKVWHYCDSTGVRGRTVTLKVKFADFQIITRSRSRVAPISDRSTLASISGELLAAQFRCGRSSSHRRVALFAVHRYGRRRSANDLGLVRRPRSPHAVEHSPIGCHFDLLRRRRLPACALEARWTAYSCDRQENYREYCYANGPQRLSRIPLRKHISGRVLTMLAGNASSSTAKMIVNSVLMTAIGNGDADALGSSADWSRRGCSGDCRR